MYSSLNHNSFENITTPESVRVSQIIHGALISGVMLFFAITLFLFDQTSPVTPPDNSMMLSISIVHAIICFSSYAVLPFLFSLVFNKTKLDQVAASKEPYGAALDMIRTGFLLRTALAEGTAFFGLTVCLIGITNGSMHADPKFLLNYGSTVLFLGYAVVSFPTKEKIVQVFKKHFIQQP